MLAKGVVAITVTKKEGITVQSVSRAMDILSVSATPRSLGSLKFPNTWVFPKARLRSGHYACQFGYLEQSIRIKNIGSA
jgi:hypothetical protein